MSGMLTKHRELRQYLGRMMRAYRVKFQTKNEQIVARGPTDLNYKFISDATFAKYVYDEIRTALQ